MGMSHPGTSGDGGRHPVPGNPPPPVRVPPAGGLIPRWWPSLGVRQQLPPDSNSLRVVPSPTGKVPPQDRAELPQDRAGLPLRGVGLSGYALKEDKWVAGDKAFGFPAEVSLPAYPPGPPNGQVPLPMLTRVDGCDTGPTNTPPWKCPPEGSSTNPGSGTTPNPLQLKNLLSPLNCSNWESTILVRPPSQSCLPRVLVQ